MLPITLYCLSFRKFIPIITNYYNSMNQKGFTLIELLVTVAIVGILSSIALPAFNDYKAKVYNTEALATQRELHFALQDWIHNVWNQENTIGSNRMHWYRRGNTTDSFGNGGDQWRDSFTLSGNVINNDDLTWWIQFYPSDDSYSINVGHCKSTISSDPNLKYNVYIAGSDVEAAVEERTKSSRLCS